MTTISHKFLSHIINPETEVLVIGTFNPEAENNPADFFYGRGRNYLWTLIPTAFGDESLKTADKEEKLAFINRNKIDFIDLIAQIEVDNGQETNYADSYIDGRVRKWRNVEEEIIKLKSLRKICLTRKTFANIPNMKIKIASLRNVCEKKGIEFQVLPTPARFYNLKKQSVWTKFFVQ